MNAIIRIRDGYGEVSAPTADLLLLNAHRLGARSGSAFEIIDPPKKNRLGMLLIAAAIAFVAAMTWGALMTGGR